MVIPSGISLNLHHELSHFISVGTIDFRMFPPEINFDTEIQISLSSYVMLYFIISTTGHTSHVKSSKDTHPIIRIGSYGEFATQLFITINCNRLM